MKKLWNNTDLLIAAAVMNYPLIGRVQPVPYALLRDLER